jgi:phosphoribosylaminoimidazole-succinocarboxamide synthase
MKPLRLFLLASGRGSHTVNLIRACEDGRLRGDVLRVVSDRPDAHAIEEARARGVPVAVLEPFREGARLAPEAEEALLALVARERPNLIALCGFMRLLRGSFLARVGVPVVNVHPSLLPAFRGLHAQRQAVEAGATQTGVTVHLVDAGMDTGPILLQRSLTIQPGESAASLAERLLPIEHETYVEALRRWQEGEPMNGPKGALRDVVIPGRAPDYRGKVRDLYLLEDRMLLVATDRVSAYDVILNEGVPGKGRVLTQISKFWFEKLASIVPTHYLSCDVADFPEPFRSHPELLEGRSMLARRAKRFDVECVVRGYLAGSGWKEYQASREVCGVKLPAGLKLSSRLPEPIFTPATKAEEGHDENIPFERMAEIVGARAAEELRRISLEIYRAAAAHAASRGLILADTKFEFGEIDGTIVWIDEALSPDSSRYWLRSTYQEGVAQDSFDKQVIRDYLDSIKWSRTPPPPPLPAEIVTKAGRRYEEALHILTGTGAGAAAGVADARSGQ